MQAAVSFSPSSPPIPIVTTTTKTTLSPPCISMQTTPLRRNSNMIKLATPVGQDANSTTVDYSSPASVFPAEACETVGGEACDVEMFPEVKLKPEPQTNNKDDSEQVDREYLEYNSSKTVFIGEACDDLGGEFCEPEYQTGTLK